MPASGDDLKKLHDEYWQRIRLYLERLVGEGEAEDLAQEVIMRAGNSLTKFRGESQLSTWIYKIATNAALDRIRQKTRSGEQLSLDAVEEREDGNVWTGETQSPDEQVIREEMNSCIRNVISTLPPIYRTVIVLSELEGFQNEESARILGLSLETVKIRLHRGRAKLKEELSRYCILFRDDKNEFACDLKGEFKIIGESVIKRK